MARDGTCKAKTKQGKSCRHTVIDANGLCAQHTSIEERQKQVEQAKAKLQKSIQRDKKKWQANPSSKCSPKGSVKALTASANPAEAALPTKLNAPVSGDVDGTAVTAISNSPRTRKSASSPSPTYQAPKLQRAGKESSPTLRKAGDDLGTKLRTARGKESGNKEGNDKDAGTFDPDKKPGSVEGTHEGESVARAHAHDAVALTGYSRGNRGDPWRVVGVDKHGHQLVEVPSWSGLSIPRGVFDPFATDWQTRTCPPRVYVEPRTFED